MEEEQRRIDYKELKEILDLKEKFNKLLSSAEKAKFQHEKILFEIEKTNFAFEKLIFNINKKYNLSDKDFVNDDGIIISHEG